MLEENNIQNDYYDKVLFQLRFTCFKSTRETLEKGVKYAQC